MQKSLCVYLRKIFFAVKLLFKIKAKTSLQAIISIQNATQVLIYESFLMIKIWTNTYY